MFIYTDDPAADYDRYDAEQQAKLDKLPKCDYCDNPIQDDYCYEINGDVLCEECLNNHFRKWVEDYVD
jgi:formylmethanofuran dehydrogenase subunit E